MTTGQAVALLLDLALVLHRRHRVVEFKKFPTTIDKTASSRSAMRGG
jgi:hypothetical protein